MIEPKDNLVRQQLNELKAISKELESDLIRLAPVYLTFALNSLAKASELTDDQAKMDAVVRALGTLFECGFALGAKSERTKNN